MKLFCITKKKKIKEGEQNTEY